jgi:hypothetical protein
MAITIFVMGITAPPADLRQSDYQMKGNLTA